MTPAGAAIFLGSVVVEVRCSPSSVAARTATCAPQVLVCGPLSFGFLAVPAWLPGPFLLVKPVEEIRIGGTPWLAQAGRAADDAQGRRYSFWRRRAGRLRQEVERLRLARNFGGAVKSCLAGRCYAESCLVGRCYARHISRSLRIWTDERRAVAQLGAVVASTDDWTRKDDADLFPEDGPELELKRSIMAKRMEKKTSLSVITALAILVVLTTQVESTAAAVSYGLEDTVRKGKKFILSPEFIEGCDGSVLLDRTPKNTKTEKESPSNGSLRGLEVIDAIRARLAKDIGVTVSCADAVVFAAREATHILSKGKIAYDVDGPSRMDCIVSSAEDAGKHLPAPTDTFDQLMQKFSAKGLDLVELVALSGAHSVGVANITSVVHRFGTPIVRREMNPMYAYAVVIEMGTHSGVVENQGP
ncbi:Peroxidase 2 [Hordeum vulgare]|nr:Peroxidase 2 [Hordeum vulgare]